MKSMDYNPDLKFKTILEDIKKSYGWQTCLADIIEIGSRRIRERVLGIDYSIFDKTIRYFKEEKGFVFSYEEALKKAADKKTH